MSSTAVQKVEEKKIISEEEKKRQELVLKLADKIDISKPDDVITFGLDAQRKISSFSDTTLNKVKSKDLDDTGKMVIQLLTEMRKVDASVKPRKGILGWIQNRTMDLQSFKSSYDSVSKNIADIVKIIEDRQVELMQDVRMLNNLYDVNSEYFRELTLYIDVGKAKIKQMKDGPLMELAQKAKETGDPEDVQAMRDMDNLITRLERKVYDLEMTKTISLEMAPQIRLIQDANSIMVEKLQSTVNNTVTVWKSQMLVAIGAMHTKEAVELQNKMADITNEMMLKNSEILKTTTIKAHKESERGIVDISTTQKVGSNLIDTIREVQEIQAEGRRNREDATAELNKLEKELCTQLMQLAQKDVQERLERATGTKEKLSLSDINNAEPLVIGLDLKAEAEKVREELEKANTVSN